MDYICSEFDEAAKNLPDVTTSMDQYIPTEGAALALAARVRLQAASPLYNGGEAARRFFGDFTRCTDGEYYVSQTYDAVSYTHLVFHVCIMGKMRIIRNLLHFGWVMPVTYVCRS